MKRRIIASLIVVGALGIAYLLWQTSGSRNVRQSSSDQTISEAKYFISFHACDSAVSTCTNPQNHLTYVAESEDGKSWSLLPGWEPFYGSVPDILVRDDILYIFTAAQGGTVTRYDLRKQKILSSETISVDDIVGFVDPAPILDEDGNIVLFFLHCRDG